MFWPDSDSCSTNGKKSLKRSHIFSMYEDWINQKCVELTWFTGLCIVPNQSAGSKPRRKYLNPCEQRNLHGLAPFNSSSTQYEPSFGAHWTTLRNFNWIIINVGKRLLTPENIIKTSIYSMAGEPSSSSLSRYITRKHLYCPLFSLQMQNNLQIRCTINLHISSHCFILVVHILVLSLQTQSSNL